MYSVYGVYFPGLQVDNPLSKAYSELGENHNQREVRAWKPTVVEVATRMMAI